MNNSKQLYEGSLVERREILPGVWEINPDPPHGRLVRFLDRAVEIGSWVAIISACIYFGLGIVVWMIG
ncbi:MAG: hypothetical protein NT047_00735 [Deltaproteobacteria bacterium]|nr:hypothetical protein [Deltaproteobacteria bacterium]